MWLQCATLCSGLGRDSIEQTRQKPLSSGSLVYTHTHPKWYQVLCRKIVQGERMGVLGQGLEGRGMLLSWVGQSREASFIGFCLSSGEASHMEVLGGRRNSRY